MRIPRAVHAGFFALVPWGCGGAPERTVSGTAGAATDPGVSASVIATARGAIEGGRLPAEVVGRLARHGTAQARRAAAMIRRVQDRFDGQGAGGPAPALARGAASPGVSTEGGPTEDRGATVRARGGEATAPAARAARRPIVRRIRLARRGAGRVELRIDAAGRVPVGVVHQPESGLVRLVFEGRAAPKIERAAGSIEGVHIASVRATQRTVVVTLRLDPGWRLVSRRANRRGARVVFESGA